MKKKKIIIILLIAIAVIAALIPFRVEYKDGGSVAYTAILYGVMHRHSMNTYNDVWGYNIGTEVRFLFFKVYDDVVFVPNEK